jgi:histidinol-phosphate/aromatic aminotransferase/cobyric acid decarboxylase-like protein
VRCAYLCGPSDFIDELRLISPPWSVGLPGQIAACEALRNPQYYREKWTETGKLREELTEELNKLGWEVVPGCANFLLCHLPENQPDVCTLIDKCKKHNLYLRDVSNMGKCFDKHTIRIAVKDRKTNTEMVRILKTVLSE